jgi:two-component system phosphate regulon sensor histidine kinase PhoR
VQHPSRLRIREWALVIGVIQGLLSAVVVYFGERVGFWKSPGAITLVVFFATFSLSFIGTYLFYTFVATIRLHALSEKIRKRFQSTEVPARTDKLEDIDHINVLDDKIDRMIESREQELKHFENLDSYRKEYLGNVSHELKTPVFNIQGYIDTLLHGGIYDPAVNTEYLRRTENSIDRLISIIDDLETISQLESGGLQLDNDAFDLVALCKEVYASLEMNAAKKKISLGFSRAYPRPIQVLADKFRIRQVLINLVMNSVKYGRENGTTIISIDAAGSDVVIEVLDNGVGIATEHLPRIFERFYRIDKGRSRAQGGTGLGLAIVKHIIEAHQRSIKVESKPGEGTVFTFSLPVTS